MIPPFDITLPPSVEQDAALAVDVLRGFAEGKPFTPGDAGRVIKAIERLHESGHAPKGGGWRCFHCGDAFTDRRAAALHFGVSEDQEPACQIKGSEGGLIGVLRDTEEALFNAHCQLHEETASTLRTWADVGSRHEAALRSAEETGYEKGLRDSSIADGFTYVVEHNPNCPKPFLVRMPVSGAIDMLPARQSKDALGYGLTFLEAFAAAKAAYDERRPATPIATIS